MVEKNLVLFVIMTFSKMQLGFYQILKKEHLTLGITNQYVVYKLTN